MPLPTDSGRGAPTCLANFRGNGIAVGTEDGYLHFYHYEGGPSKHFTHIKQWTCVELKTAKIVGLNTHEVSKDDLQLAVVAKS